MIGRKTKTNFPVYYLSKILLIISWVKTKSRVYDSDKDQEKPALQVALQYGFLGILYKTQFRCLVKLDPSWHLMTFATLQKFYLGTVNRLFLAGWWHIQYLLMFRVNWELQDIT